MRLIKSSAAAVLIILSGLLSSCQKDMVQTTSQSLTANQSDTITATQLKDSTLYFSRDFYLWYNQIPSNFSLQTYADPNEVMMAIRAYSIEPGYSTAVDRWSYAIKKADWNNLSTGVGLAADASTGDFGLNVFFLTQNDLRVKYVEKESAAGLAGVRRGWRITKINGSTNITTNNSSTIVSAVYQSQSGTFTFQKPDGTSIEITLKATGYHTQPLILDSVYTAGSKRVGYIVFNSFLGDTTQMYNNFERVFSRFSQQQVNELIIDLRYNSGGYVSAQEKLADYIVNSANNGQVMMSEQFNDKHSNYNNTTKFAKLGMVNVSRVSFIVSSNTASASELLINNLKPYMDVRLVGPSKTHGKPVGFFPISVGDWYVFPVSFRSVNKNGEGNYFNGLTLTNTAADGLDKDWGDRNESALAYILNGISNGTYRTSITTTNIDREVESANSILSADQFKGAVDTRRMF